MSLAAAKPGAQAPIDHVDLSRDDEQEAPTAPTEPKPTSGPPAQKAPLLGAGQPVWHFIKLKPSDVTYDESQETTGVWMPGFVIKAGTTGKCSVRTSGLSLAAVTPREVAGKKRKSPESPEGEEEEKSGDEDDNAPLVRPNRPLQPAAAPAAAPAAPKPKAKKIKTMGPSPGPERTAVARILVLTNNDDCPGERGVLLAPMDPLKKAHLFIAGADMALPCDTGLWTEVALSLAPGAGKKAPQIDLRAMADTVAKYLGVTPENLTCAIAFDRTAAILHDPSFAELPNVQLICPHLVQKLGGAAAAWKLKAFARSPAYQSLLGSAASTSASSSSSASSASSPAKPKPPAAPATVPAQSATSPAGRPSAEDTVGSMLDSIIGAIDGLEPAEGPEVFDLTQGD